MEVQAVAGLDRKRTRDEEDDSSFAYSPEREESPEAKRLRENLLDILDDDDGAVDRNPTAVGELDSVLRSLEEEIGLSAVSPVREEADQVSPAQAWCGEAEWEEGDGDCSRQLQQTELGFLLEASDDELGLPPSGPSTSEEEGQQFEDETASSAFLPVASEDAVGLGSQIWGFEDDMPSPYEGFGFGYPSGAGDDNGFHGACDSAPGSAGGVSGDGSLFDAEDGVMFHGGLFDDFSDADAPSDLLWRQETLPAL